MISNEPDIAEILKSRRISLARHDCGGWMVKHYVRLQYGNRTGKDREDDQDNGEFIE